jgi:hypothetical protein
LVFQIPIRTFNTNWYFQIPIGTSKYQLVLPNTIGTSNANCYFKCQLLRDNRLSHIKTGPLYCITLCLVIDNFWLPVVPPFIEWNVEPEMSPLCKLEESMTKDQSSRPGGGINLSTKMYKLTYGSSSTTFWKVSSKTFECQFLTGRVLEWYAFTYEQNEQKSKSKIKIKTKSQSKI